MLPANLGFWPFLGDRIFFAVIRSTERRHHEALVVVYKAYLPEDEAVLDVPLPLVVR